MKIFGRNPVIERLRANPRSVRKIYIEHGFKGTTYIHKKARPFGISIYPVTKNKMQKIGRDINTQGILIEVDDFEYLDFNDMLDYAFDKKRSMLFMDGLKDPQNLGAIIRSAACLGRFSIVLPTHDSVGITESVLRVASGGDNYISVSRVGNISNAIEKAKEKGFWIVGAVVKGGEPLTEARFNYPLGIVIGSEQKGIRDVVLKKLDLQVTIPMSIDTLSFNAAHAATILCYEITRQKKSH